MCDHVQETTTRYDRAEKRLVFLMVCPICRSERPIETVDYEPRPLLPAA